ncbi:MAG: hypothetical protein ACI8P3_001274 [Saprospiraceae bacterium]|jgi:hypothetical protein
MILCYISVGQCPGGAVFGSEPEIYLRGSCLSGMAIPDMSPLRRALIIFKASLGSVLNSDSL